jgi:protein kinase-like protein
VTVPSLLARKWDVLSQAIGRSGEKDRTSETTFANLRSGVAPQAKLSGFPSLLTLNRKFGPYRVVQLLKPGGMGEVAIADDARLPRQVVLKCLSGRWLATPWSRERLMREARAAAALSHPNIATLYDVLEDTEQPMLVMEYVEGKTLRDVLLEGPLPVGLALRYAIQVTDAVSYAHDRGIIHCDIKPTNVQITPGHVAKVLDFGLAHAQFDAGGELSRSEAGKVMGTPGYMPPERLIDGTVNAAGDVYALGVVLFEMLTNRAPYTEIGPQLMASVLATDAPAPSSLVPGLPSQLDAIVARALARNPEFRYRSARELARDLVEALSAIEGRVWSGQLQPMLPPKPAIDWRRLALAAFVTLAFVVLAGFTTTTMYLSPLGISEGFQRESAWSWPKWGLQTFTAPVIFMAMLALPAVLTAFMARVLWSHVAAVRKACSPLVARCRGALARLNAEPTSLLAPLLLTVQIGVLVLYAWRFRAIIAGLDALYVQQPPGSLAALSPANRVEHNDLGQWLSVQLLVFGAAWYQLLKRRWMRKDREAGSVVFGGLAVLFLSFLFFQVIPFRVLYHTEAERVLYSGRTCYLVGQRADEALLFCPLQTPPWKQVVELSDPELTRQGTFESVFAAFDSRN